MKKLYLSRSLSLLMTIFVFVAVNFHELNAQTPGLIIKPISGGGVTVLDPDGDGYVSQKTNGFQSGFTNPPDNDVLQSEIPYASLVRPDPSGDLMVGPNCLYGDIVGTDASGNNAVMTYLDANDNLLFRFRIGNYASNSKAYSILIDTDQKFGFTGVNSDPNAVPGNPGFEVEIVLETNFGVEVYNIDGTTNTSTPVINFTTNPYSSNCQKSVAITTACLTPDYFYDFYIPFAQLSSIAGLGITKSTPLRMVALTGMNPKPTTGQSTQGDIGGTSATGSLDAIFSTLVESQIPTSVTSINSGVLDRSACPSINGVAVGSATITGTSAEVSGTTINVSVYQSNGTTLVGSGTTTTSGTSWTINVSTLDPSVTLTAGYIVKATATAIGKGVSYDYCDIESVTNCSVQTETLGVTVEKISGDKGFILTPTSWPIGTIVTWYMADYSIATFLSGNGGNIPNPVTTTTSNATVSFECKTGQCFPEGVYYFTFQKPEECVSDFIESCLFTTGVTSTTPTISTGTITTSTTSISGNGTAPGSQIIIYANGTRIASATSAAATPYAWTASVSSLSLCQVITAKQIVSGQCLSAASTGVTVSRKAVAPIISTAGCSSTVPNYISGFSTETGATVTLYRTSPTTATLGTAIVQNDGTWSVTGLSLIIGNVIEAAVTSGSCLSASARSNSVTISAQTNISGYTIGFSTPITEGQTAVSGTISGLTGSEVLKLYVDETYVGSTSAFIAGAWTVSGLNLFDLAAGSKVQVSLTGTGCESALSATTATVQCEPPADKTILANPSSVCANSYGTITVQSSQSGVLYTPVTSDGTTVFGYSQMGNGSDINLTTYALTADPTIVKVKASKFPIGSCDLLLSGTGVSFVVSSLPAAPTAGSPQIFCGATTLANLAVSVPGGTTLKWYTATTGGASIPSSTTLADGTTYYSESENATTGCKSNTRTAVLVVAGTPAAPLANASQTFCSGATVADLAASLPGPGTVSWFAAPSGGTAILPGTSLVTGNYYAETAQTGCVSSSRTAVAVTVIPIPTITATSPAARCGSGTVTLGATSSAGIINWYATSTGGISAGTGTTFTTPSISAATTFFADATANGCTTAARTAVIATINTPPIITVTTPATCASGFLTYSVEVMLSAGTLTSTSGTVVNTSGSVWRISGVSIGTGITLTATGVNGCLNTLAITAPDCNCAVIASPASGGNKEYCSGSPVPAIEATVLTGQTVDWYTTPTGGTASATGTTSFTPSSAGTYYAEARNTTTNCKSSSRTAVSLTSNPSPAPTAMTSVVCTGVGFAVTPINGINGIVPPGTTFSWGTPSGAGFSGGAAGSGAANIFGTLTNTTKTTQTAIYTVTPKSGGCMGPIFTVTVTITPNAGITSVTGTTPLAIAGTTTYTANTVVLGGGTGTWSSSNAAIATVNSSTGLVTGVSAGTCNIIYTLTGGCGGTVSALQSITVIPTVSFTSASQNSADESGTLTITVQLSSVSAQTVTVPFTLSGTASGSGGGTDYNIIASPITITAGSTTGTTTITIVGDVRVEGNETVVLTMGSPTNAAQGVIIVHTANITDDDFYPAGDSDGDGIPNTTDLDSDNDGIPDTVEDLVDADGDGIADRFDLDSDNDGIYDILEAGGTDTNFDGRVDNFVDANGNGLTDQYDALCNNTTVKGRAITVNTISGTVANSGQAVDVSSTTPATLQSGGATIDVILEHVVPFGQTIYVVLASDRNGKTSSGTIQQSFDGLNYSNSHSFITTDDIAFTVTYTVSTSNARYIRITRTDATESLNVYILTYSFTICNGVTGSAISDLDSDLDGIKNRVETDADNDGCPDVKEAGFTDANSDGRLDGTGFSSTGKVTGNTNGYTIPADANSNGVFDFREANPAAVGGTVSGGTTICAGSTSGTLTLSGYTGRITKWQSSVSPFSTWTDIAHTSTTYISGILTQTTQFRAMVTSSVCSSDNSVPVLVTVTPRGSWLGGTSGAETNWNTASNWSCSVIPDLTTNVQIPNVAYQPILNSGAVGAAKNIVIDSGSSLTVSGNTIQIGGTITNSGIFTATGGTIEMKGSTAQIIGANVFAGNTIMNLTINNSNGVTLQGPLSVTGIVKVTPVNGNLASGGNLTLISSATQTALIDGTGMGQVLGNVTMQRYLPSAFGYKYFSTPFQSTTVDAFAPYVNLGTSSFPAFYKYDENNLRDSLGIKLYQSGWVRYLAGNLSPMSGYAANFGAATPAKTISMTGTASNGSMSVQLYNNNRKYTKGFNLVGNPYPSPIDWNKAGWTKTNIDDALYFFNAGNTDQYTGIYSSCIGNVSTITANNNIIASMQGFFVHVSDGSYPVSATLGFTNSVRTNDLIMIFKEAVIDDRTILRFAASFETKNAIADAAVIYFDDQANRSFDNDKDALKMLNTDLLVPNIYTLSTDTKQLSINGMQQPADNNSTIPLGITTYSDGWINFNAKDISQLPPSMHLYLVDAEQGVTRDLKQQPEYRFYLKKGEYNTRFTLVFSLADIVKPPVIVEKMFAISRLGNQLIVKVNLPLNVSGNLMVTNLLGQVILQKAVSEIETVEINPYGGSSVYIVTLVSGRRKESEKILIRKDYE